LRKLKVGSLRSYLSLGLLVVTFFFFMVSIQLHVSPYLQGSNPYTNMEERIGSVISRESSHEDEIWTSEPSIAFFAQRIITSPISKNWPFGGFFNDVFSADWTDFSGVTHHGLNIVTPDMFLESWKSKNTKILVFIHGYGYGPVPYPDDLMWNGFDGQKGVKNWVMSYYRLEYNFTSSEVLYEYDIWVRNEYDFS
jgi:hypothetical protein